MAIKQSKNRTTTEFGDFQTPETLALLTTQLLRRLGIKPRSIIEPTCGKGAFVSAAASSFSDAETIIGVDINQSYLNVAKNAMKQQDERIKFVQGDFFKFDWESIISQSDKPFLIIGNPPWVTSSNLGAIDSDNLPEKSNFHGRQGIEAITGKSNFDISEWMLLRYLDWLKNDEGTIAVLCKTSVARKILLHIWKKKGALHAAHIYKIDALQHFGAAVDACFFILELNPKAQTLSCDVFDALNATTPSHKLGFLDGHIISDITTFNRHRHLLGIDGNYTWRSGIKHDCSKIMELAITPDGYQNGLGEIVPIEETFLFPMLKSSDIGNGRIICRRMMLVTQKLIGENTNYIKTDAPKTWDYLQQSAVLLSKRGSVIYKNKPAFSIFGVGSYSFAPWKIAISGFYKNLQFVKIGSVKNRPVVVDDTVYFLPCQSEEEACFIEELLQSQEAHEFLRSMIHWDEKRPITVEILKRLNLKNLAVMMGRTKDYEFFTQSKQQIPLMPLFQKSA